MEQNKMTKQELQAKLEEMEYALKDAAKTFAAIEELIKKVNYHPDAPTEVSAAYTIGAIRATAWRGLATTGTTI